MSAIAIPFPDGMEGANVGAGAIAGAILIALTIADTLTKSGENFSDDEQVTNCSDVFKKTIKAFDGDRIQKLIANHCYESKKSTKRFRRYKPSSKN